MVFQNRSKPCNSSRRLSLSEWDNAPIEQVSGDGDTARPPIVMTGSTSLSSGDNDANDEPAAAASAPQMNLSRIGLRYSTKRGQDAEDDVDDGTQARVSHDHNRHSHHHQRRGPAKRMSFSHHKRRHSDIDDLTVAPSSSASRTSYSSSAGTNIWTKLMGRSGTEGLWDGLNTKSGNAYEDRNNKFNDDDEDGEEERESCANSMQRWGLAWWYETRHFFKTVGKHPHISILSLLTFGILCTVGMVAINSERDAYIQKQKGTAEFVARETAQWFSNEFRRAMLPLYSVQQGVIHSGYFDDLPRQIGPYPNLVVPESEETPFTKRDVTGICDDPHVISKWRSIVEPINADNDLDGIVVGYRLFPNNVACLTEPHMQESTEHFKAEDFPQGEDTLLASENVFGLDTGHSAFPLWKMITTDLFINKQFNIFGPFAMPPMSELICGHLAIWTKPEEAIFDTATFNNTLDVHGTKVEGAWGFVVNFLDWTKLKAKSNIYKRFSSCKLEFQLSRVGGATVQTVDSALLAESPKSNLLDDANSIVVETESMHGVWQNRVGSLSGWAPPWYPAAVAGVVLTSLILGLLTASTLVERQLHRNLLYKVMPRRAIAKLHRGQTVVENYNIVTMFFSDIVGFTSMSGSMRPIQVMEMLNELYTELDKLVQKHQIYKVETIGDAYMVVGGAPDRVPAPLAAERVALFALDAIDFVKSFRTKDGDKVFIRAGLASGPTVAGVVGQAMPRYCFFGDTVNFASRMESTSKKMRIQCAEITFRLLQDAPNMNFGLKKRMEGDVAGVQIKGKGHHITYWIEKSTPRESLKVSDVAAQVKSELLSKVSEVEEVPQDPEEGKCGASKTNDENVGYEEFLNIMNSGSKPDQ